MSMNASRRRVLVTLNAPTEVRRDETVILNPKDLNWKMVFRGVANALGYKQSSEIVRLRNPYHHHSADAFPEVELGMLGTRQGRTVHFRFGTHNHGITRDLREPIPQRSANTVDESIQILLEFGQQHPDGRFLDDSKDPRFESMKRILEQLEDGTPGRPQSQRLKVKLHRRREEGLVTAMVQTTDKIAVTTWGAAEFFSRVRSLIQAVSTEELEGIVLSTDVLEQTLRRRLSSIAPTEPAIRRSIEFPPEMKDAGVSLLSHFAKYLKLKNPDVEAAVRITQEGAGLVSLEIETPEGDVERVEHSLEDFGLVAAGHKAPEEWLHDSLHIARLETDLRLVRMQLENEQQFRLIESEQAQKIESLKTREIDALTRQISATEDHVGTLVAQNRVLGELMAVSLGQRDVTLQLIENLVDRIATGSADPSQEMASAEAIALASGWDDQELLRAFEMAREKDLGRFEEFSRNVAASGIASGLMEVLKTLI